MVLTVGQTTTFFEDADHIGLPNRMRVALDGQGITLVLDLGEWEDDDWDVWAGICRKPPHIVDHNNAAVTINQAPFVLSIKSLKGERLFLP